jgi:hypothetical protein
VEPVGTKVEQKKAVDQKKDNDRINREQKKIDGPSKF